MVSRRHLYDNRQKSECQQKLVHFYRHEKIKMIAGDREQTEVKQILNNFKIIFKVINDKDDFKAAVKKLLCKRLAKIRSPNFSCNKRNVE